MKWLAGRQGTGYRKLRLAGWGRVFDLWLLHYPEGSSIDWHRDPIKGRRHYRINVEVWRAELGGVFEAYPTSRVSPIWHDYWTRTRPRRVFFRPDLWRHSVSRIERGSRWVLSLGWTRRA